MNLEIKTGNLNDEELFQLSKFEQENEVIVDKDFYQEAKYFVIKRFYDKEEFLGFAVMFLGCNGLVSNDISLEHVTFLKSDMETILSCLTKLSEDRNYPITVERVLYNSEMFSASQKEILEQCGIQEFSKTR